MDDYDDEDDDNDDDDDDDDDGGDDDDDAADDDDAQRGVALPTYGNIPLPFGCGVILHPPAMKHEPTSLECSFNLERDDATGSLDFPLRPPVPVFNIDIRLRVE